MKQKMSRLNSSLIFLNSALSIFIVMSCSDSESAVRPDDQVAPSESLYCLQGGPAFDPIFIKFYLRDPGSTESLPPSYWLKIINDTNYNIADRSEFVMALFKREVKPGMVLKNFPPLFSHPDWATVSIYEIEQKRGRYRNGGNWKDIGYYLQNSQRDYSDSILKEFKASVFEKESKLFCIETMRTTNQNGDILNDCPLEIYLGLKTSADGATIDNYLRFGKSNRADEIIVVDVFFNGMNSITYR